MGHGKEVFAANCAACHGENGQGGIKDRLVGGQGTLTSDQADQDGRKALLAYATTLFDYIHRAMPYQAPGSLSVDDYYACHGVHPELERNFAARYGKLDKGTLPKMKMPNRDGFIPDPEFSTITNSR